jgi:hypothetical protein
MIPMGCRNQMTPLKLSLSTGVHFATYFITPLPKTKRGNYGILVVVDRLSKIMHAIPTPSHCTAIATAKPNHEFIYI